MKTELLYMKLLARNYSRNQHVTTTAKSKMAHLFATAFAKRKWTNADAAAHLEVGEVVIVNLLQGRPSLDVYVRCLLKLGCNVDIDITETILPFERSITDVALP